MPLCDTTTDLGELGGWRAHQCCVTQHPEGELKLRPRSIRDKWVKSDVNIMNFSTIFNFFEMHLYMPLLKRSIYYASTYVITLGSLDLTAWPPHCCLQLYCKLYFGKGHSRPELDWLCAGGP